MRLLCIRLLCIRLRLLCIRLLCISLRLLCIRLRLLCLRLLCLRRVRLVLLPPQPKSLIGFTLDDQSVGGGELDNKSSNGEFVDGDGDGLFCVGRNNLSIQSDGVGGNGFDGLEDGTGLCNGTAGLDGGCNGTANKSANSESDVEGSDDFELPNIFSIQFASSLRFSTSNFLTIGRIE